MLKYIITKFYLGDVGVIEIDEAEYYRIKTARGNLFEALFLEEKFDLVMENYYEYETELLSLASRMMIFQGDDYFSMSRDRNLISRRIVNLLTAGRMYVEQSIRHIQNIYGRDSSILNLVKSEKLLQEEKYLGFRVMEALRNFVQHSDIPIHSVSFSNEVVDRKQDDFKLLHLTIPLMNFAALEEDPRFKKPVLLELEPLQVKGQIDIRPLIREYIEGIGNLHIKIRELIRPDITVWEGILSDTIAKFHNQFPDDPSSSGLVIAIEKENGHLEEYKSIFKEFIERRQLLERKNTNFGNMPKRYASNEIRNKNS